MHAFCYMPDQNTVLRPCSDDIVLDFGGYMKAKTGKNNLHKLHI